MLNPTVALETVWADRGGREGQLTLHLPFSLDRSALLSQALTLITFVSGISNAALVRYHLIYKGRPDSPTEASLASDTRVFVGIFYRSEDETRYEALWIPSPVAAIFETEGAYAGSRVDRSSPLVAGFVSGTALAGTQTLEGDPWPPIYVVGGRRL